MSEGKQFEIPPKSNASQSVEALLENGEIEKVERLRGFPDVSVVDIKNDGRALFKVSTDEFIEMRSKIFERSNIELLIAELDQILGFNLVPPIVAREVYGQKGVLQQLMEARPIEMPDGYQRPDLTGWQDVLDAEELLKAAVFDYIIGAKDRHGGNFLIDIPRKKVWLIDHDYLMFFQDLGYGSDIVRAALGKDAARLNDQLKNSLRNLLNVVDGLFTKFPSDAAKAILSGVKNRTEELLKTSQIPNLA